MEQYLIAIELEMPVVVARNRATGHMIRGMDHIPGSTLRGALAAFFKDSEFSNKGIAHQMFVAGKLQVPNLYPSVDGEPSRPIPLSALTCKYHPGFRGMAGSHRVRDALLMERVHEECGAEECGAPLESLTGYCRMVSGTRYQEVKPSQRRIAHTAISVHRQVASPGDLFTYEALDAWNTPTARQGFSGLVRVSDCRYLELVEERLNSRGRRLRLGKAATRGYGEVGVAPMVPFPTYLPPLAERMTGLNRKAWETLTAVNDGTNPGFFALTLDSDAVLLDPLLRYRTYIDVPDLIDATGNRAFAGFRLRRHFCAIDHISGWNQKLKLPRETEIAIRRGSCFLFECPEASMLDEVRADLATIEEEGIGERRAEGFGRLVVCDPFHWRGGEL